MVLQYSKYTVKVLLSNYKRLIFQSDQVTDGDRSVLLDKTCGVNRPGTITSNTGRSASFINVIISNHNLSSFIHVSYIKAMVEAQFRPLKTFILFYFICNTSYILHKFLYKQYISSYVSYSF